MARETNRVTRDAQLPNGEYVTSLASFDFYAMVNLEIYELNVRNYAFLHALRRFDPKRYRICHDNVTHENDDLYFNFKQQVFATNSSLNSFIASWLGFARNFLILFFCFARKGYALYRKLANVRIYIGYVL